MSINKNSIICIKIENPGQFLVKNEKYIFNEITNTYQVLFNLNDIGDKYIKQINDDKFNLHIPMKKNGHMMTVIITVDLKNRNNQTNIINCSSYAKIN